MVEGGQGKETNVASLDNIVPSCPSGLCISKADFLRTDFSVDTFFMEQSVKETPLDTMRDDLGLYLKVLRSSMIELINQDYADFVNLSTNLVGLDKSIVTVTEPLVTFHQEIQKVNSSISLSLSEVRVKLERQGVIRAEKTSLANLQRIVDTLTKLERMVGEEDNVKTTDTAERIATEINQLNFAVWKMKDSALVSDLQPRLEKVVDQLNTWLDSTLLTAVKEKTGNLSRICRIYYTIGRVSGAEHLVRKQVVRPQLDILLPGDEVTNVGELCDKVLAIIPEQLGELVRLTMDKGRLVGGSVEGFNFLLNSYWMEVVEMFSSSLSHLTSAGNPADFFTNYTTVCDKFLGDFEAHFPDEDSLNQLRSHESYATFLAAWNLPLYFQIRFQEIARPFELSLTTNELIRVQQADTTNFSLKATEEAHRAISLCFSTSIFLRPLTAKFLRLALQVISRYKVWSASCVSTFSQGDNSKTGMKRSTTTKDLQDIPTTITSTTTMKKSSSDAHLSDKDITPDTSPLTITDLVILYTDITRLANILPNLLTDLISSVLPDTGGTDLRPAVMSAVSGLESVLPNISNKLVEHLTNSASKLVKGVGEIPRLYRRTNRETPSKPCPYIATIVEDFKTFGRDQTKFCSDSMMISWLDSAAEVMLGNYLVQVSDVLTNVTKMEESLRKLKKVRERGGGSGKEGLGDSRGSGGLTDDDKIRLQLYVDVMFCLREFELLGCRVEIGSKVKEVVESAVSGFISDLKV